MTRGAFGGPQKRAAALAFLAESSRQAKELTKKRQLRQSYTKFFKTDDGRAFARSFGKSIPLGNGYKRRNCNGEADIDFCDPADIPRSSVLDHPIDHIEPSEDFRAIDGISRDEIKSASEIFESSMRWCVDSPALVEKGLRLAVVISIMRPDLRAGLKIDEQRARIFAEANAHLNGAMELTGRLFGPVLEWLRRGDRVSELGERIMVLFYILRPDLIGESTLASLGNLSNKTRQAKDKLANCLRDTYCGIKARSMRGDLTRSRCRESQLTH
jgi:hypothetical protein